MAELSLEFRELHTFMSEVVLDHPESTYSDLMHHRRLHKRLANGPRVQFSLSDEGGDQTEFGVRLGRFSLTDEEGWHVYDMYADGRVWNFESVRDPSKQTGDEGRWLDDAAIAVFHEYLAGLNDKIWPVAA